MPTTRTVNSIRERIWRLQMVPLQKQLDRLEKRIDRVLQHVSGQERFEKIHNASPKQVHFVKRLYQHKARVQKRIDRLNARNPQPQKLHNPVYQARPLQINLGPQNTPKTAGAPSLGRSSTYSQVNHAISTAGKQKQPVTRRPNTAPNIAPSSPVRAKRTMRQHNFTVQQSNLIRNQPRYSKPHENRLSAADRQAHDVVSRGWYLGAKDLNPDQKANVIAKLQSAKAGADAGVGGRAAWIKNACPPVPKHEPSPKGAGAPRAGAGR